MRISKIYLLLSFGKVFGWIFGRIFSCNAVWYSDMWCVFAGKSCITVFFLHTAKNLYKTNANMFERETIMSNRGKQDIPIGRIYNAFFLKMVLSWDVSLVNEVYRVS